MHALCPKRLSVPPMFLAFYHSAEGASQMQGGQIKQKSVSPHTHQPTANRRKVHKVYFSVTQSALSKCSSKLFNNTTSTQLPGKLLANFSNGSGTSCSLKDAAWHLMVRPPGWPPISPPTHWRSSAHSISKALALSTLSATARVGLHLECSRGSTAWPAEERCRPRDNCPRAPGTIHAWGARAHLSTERTLPTWAPWTLHTAHQAMPQMGHTSTINPRAQLAPTLEEPM